MKKYAFLLCLTILILCTGIALADADLQAWPGQPPADPFKDLLKGYNEHINDKGVSVEFAMDDKYYILKDMTRSWYSDSNGQNTQNTSAKVRLEAYIPCYIEMKVTGNKGQTILKSYGPNASAEDGPHNNYMLLFDNEVGGFVDERWNSLGHGKNAQVEPGPDKYIQGCDLFKVEVYANDTFRYQVESAPLVPVDADIDSANSNNLLELDMRWNINNTWSSTYRFTKPETKIIADNQKACDSLVIYHQFRVPYSRNTAHGQYTGNVIFRALTI